MSISVGYLAVGDELLDGRVVNTNLTYLATQLSELNLSIGSSLIVSDAPNDIKQGLDYFIDKVSILFITGGLGPTEDDRTSSVLAEYAGYALVCNEDVLEHIKQFFYSKNRPFYESNTKQAFFPDSARIIPNEIGTAPGYILTVRETICIVLPGVPREMKRLFEDTCMPYLRDSYEIPFMKTKTWITFGMGESELFDRLKGLYPLPEFVSIGYRAHFPEVHVTLKTLESSFPNDLVSQIESLLSRQIVATDSDTFLGAVANKLVSEKCRISTAESCTGGLVSHLLTSVSGSSAFFNQSFVTYSNQSKCNELGVLESTILTFGEVSEACAKEMVQGLVERTGSDYAISITGIAGPDGGTEKKPVGTVYIGIQTPTGTQVYHHQFHGTRDQIRLRSAYYALFYILKT